MIKEFSFKNKSNYIRIGFLFLLIISLLIIYRYYFKGNSYFMYVDIGSDTFSQYYPFYISIVNSIRNGTFSIWNFSYGLGINLLDNIFWITDPFAIVAIIISAIISPGIMALLLVYMQIAKVLVLFFLGYKFTSYHVKDCFSICLSAYLFALNGFIILWGQHYFMGTALVYMMLMLIAVENYISNKKEIGEIFFIIAISLTLMFSYYFGYMILIVSAIYFLFRVYGPLNLKLSIKDFCNVIIGVLISMPIFLPSVLNVIKSSNRLSSTVSLADKINMSIVNSFNIDNIGIHFSRLISSNLLCINDISKIYTGNYYEAPQLYITPFILFFMIQWIIYEIDLTRVNKKTKYVLLKWSVFIIFIFTDFAALILSGFVLASYRYTYTIIPFFMILIGLVWEKVIKERKVSLIGVFISFVITLFSWYYSYSHCTEEVIHYSLVFIKVVIAGYILLALFTMLCKKQFFLSKVFLVSFIFLISFISLNEGWFQTNQRSFIRKESYPLIWESGKIVGDTTRAIEWIKENDDSFFRIEKTYYDYYPYADPLLYGYSSASWYNSMQGDMINAFYNYIYESDYVGDAIASFRLENNLDIMALSILDSKYILSGYEIENENLSLIHKEGNCLIYRNNTTSEVVKLYNGCIKDSDFKTLSKEEKINVLKNNIVLYDQDFDDIYKEKENALIDIFAGNVGTFKFIDYTKLVGKVNCDNNCYLLISIPQKDGWDVYVDNKKISKFTVDYAFIGAQIEKGEHEIELRYKVPYIKLGTILGLIGMILLMIKLFYIQRHKCTSILVE